MKNIATVLINNIKREYNYQTVKPKSIVFDHIPKCAGTTVFSYLKKYYPYRLTYETLASHDFVNKFKQYSIKKRNQYKFITGHLAFLLADYASPDTLLVTIIREPIDRIISHYFYVKDKKNPKLYQKVFVENNISLKDYCAMIESDELSNYYVKRYSGWNNKRIESFPEGAINKAYNNIITKYNHVGFQDKIEEFMVKLIEISNLPKDSYHNKYVNQTAARKSIKQIDIDIINEIKKYNTLDIKLYKKLRERYLVINSEKEKHSTYK